MGIWDLQTGKLISKLADTPLGAIVTHACMTHDGKLVISQQLIANICAGECTEWGGPGMMFQIRCFVGIG